MRVFIAIVALLVAFGAAEVPPYTLYTQSPFDAFWNSNNIDDATKEAERIVKSGVSFDEAWARLKKGRAFSSQRNGVISIRFPAGNGLSFDNMVAIPDEYDASRAWPLRVQLHGAVGRPSPTAQQPGRPLLQNPRPNRIEGEPQIYAHPSGWANAQWWDENQVDNILRLVDAIKRRYNVDESRIYLTGISDGGTGVYYMAMREPTVWSSFLPLNGSMEVIRSPNNGADGELYGNNLVNKPLFIVNGELDQLYPVRQIEPHIRWFERMRVPHTFRPQAGAGHNTAWWPSEREPFERFVREHPRDPHPAKLSWETERIDRFNRVHWLVITQLGAAASDVPLEDPGFFIHSRPSGRVDIERQDNVFVARTRGVHEFRLLLSPDVVDFDKPVSVVVNGKPAFQHAVKKEVATLLKWAARDNDRTMLYAAEVKIVVP